MSRFTDRTRDMCTPRFLWMPAHRIHRKMPRFHDAHLGPVIQVKISMIFIFTSHTKTILPLASQSTQYLLSSSRSICVSIVWHFSCINFVRSLSFRVLIFTRWFGIQFHKLTHKKTAPPININTKYFSVPINSSNN